MSLLVGWYRAGYERQMHAAGVEEASAVPMEETKHVALMGWLAGQVCSAICTVEGMVLCRDAAIFSLQNCSGGVLWGVTWGG